MDSLQRMPCTSQETHHAKVGDKGEPQGMGREGQGGEYKHWMCGCSESVMDREFRLGLIQDCNYSSRKRDVCRIFPYQ